MTNQNADCTCSARQPDQLMHSLSCAKNATPADSNPKGEPRSASAKDTLARLPSIPSNLGITEALEATENIGKGIHGMANWSDPPAEAREGQVACSLSGGIYDPNCHLCQPTSEETDG